MQKKFVMGILPYQSANAALDNLAEAEFTDVSVIMSDAAKARQLAKDIGPLRNIYGDNIAKALNKYGVSRDTIAVVQSALQKGFVLVAFSIIPGSVDAAKEMLQNAGANQIEII